MLNYISKIYISLTVVLCFDVSSVRCLQADELSAEEIMAKSRTAMSQPLRYTSVSADGVEMTVYRKTLPNGSIAMLTNFPATKEISITYDKKHYDIHLEHQIAIDMSNVFQSANNLANSLVSDIQDDIKRKFYETAGVVKYNDRDCYEILEKITPEFKAAVWDKISENLRDKFPAKSRLLIDKESYLVQMREKFTEEGVTLSKIEYKDIHPQPDLSDDFFQLPPGLEVLSPQSIKEHTAIIKDRLMPQHTPVDVKVEFEKIEKEVKEKNPLRPRRDVRKEAEEATRQFREQAELTKERVLAREEYPLPEVSSNRWIVFVAVNGTGVALLLLIFFFRWHYRSR